MTAILEPPTTTGRVEPAPAEPAVTPPPPAPVPKPPPVAAARTRQPRARPPLTATGIRVIGTALAGLFTVGLVLEPPPDGADPVLPAWIGVLETGVTVALLASIAGFLLGRRWALGAGAAFGAGLLTASALCPTLDHHVLAGWWFGQLAVAAVMVALPAAALALTRRAEET